MSLLVEIEKDYGGFHLCARFETNGGITGLLGASGCGKSQTLRCIAGVQTPDQGRIVLDGVTLYDSERHINLTPQQPGRGISVPELRALPEHDGAGQHFNGLRREKDAAKKQAAFEHAIHLLKLEGLEDRRPAQLSGGQAQRVALARMLVSRPKALLLDEPFSAIDSHLRDQLQVDLLALLADFPGDMVIVTHSRDEAYHMCGQIAVMDAGRVLVHGPTKQVFADPRTVQGGRLTGCKNIFPARKVDDHTIFVPDWGVDLHPARMVEDGLVAMGVRAILSARKRCGTRLPSTAWARWKSPLSGSSGCAPRVRPPEARISGGVSRKRSSPKPCPPGWAWPRNRCFCSTNKT